MRYVSPQCKLISVNKQSEDVCVCYVVMLTCFCLCFVCLNEKISADVSEYLIFKLPNIDMGIKNNLSVGLLVLKEEIKRIYFIILEAKNRIYRVLVRRII